MSASTGRAARIAWGWVLGALFVLLAVALISGAVASHNYGNAKQGYAHRTHFYEVVAGKITDLQPTVDDTLASDLSKISVSRLADFRGDSNRYGGVSSDLGVKVFADCGGDCGALTDQMIQNVTDAKNGNVSAALGSNRPSKASSSLTGIALVAIVLWLAIAGLGLASPMLRRRKRHEKLRRAYPDECGTIDRLNAAMDAIAPGKIDLMSRRQATISRGQYDELKRMRDGIEEALQVRIDPTFASSSPQLASRQVEKLMTEASLTLKSVETGNTTADYGS